jgi:uncharacterized protein (TIGR02145 family)
MKQTIFVTVMALLSLNFAQAQNNLYLNPNLTYGSVTDIDGNQYATIQIGKQIWMAENLKTTQYNDGKPIPNVTDDKKWEKLNTGAWCYYDNKPDNNTLYGKLYNWYVVNTGKLCPKGWHIPTTEEWDEFVISLGGSVNNSGSYSVDGGKMKATALWTAPKINATNSSGFTALPGGYRNFSTLDTRISNSNMFRNIGHASFWWTASEYGTLTASNCYLTENYNTLDNYRTPKTSGYSCRCVKD